MTPLDAARAVAIRYRNALHQAYPAECRRHDAQSIRDGQGWVAPVTLPEQADHNALDAELTAVDIERIWRIPAATIYAWASKGVLEKRCNPDGHIVYRVGDVLACQARRHKTAK